MSEILLSVSNCRYDNIYEFIKFFPNQISKIKYLRIIVGEILDSIHRTSIWWILSTSPWKPFYLYCPRSLLNDNDRQRLTSSSRRSVPRARRLLYSLSRICLACRDQIRVNIIEVTFYLENHSDYIYLRKHSNTLFYLQGSHFFHPLYL